MSAFEWTQVESLFHQALNYPPTERKTFLQASCGGETALFHEVMSLLEHVSPSDSFFDSFAKGIQEGWEESPPLEAGTVLGAYTVLHEIGRGGMSVVYAAQRTEGDYQAQVAIKVLKKGMDTAGILGRFRRERQLLADLRHPGIASLLDGGETDSGQPYLVMAYIEGQPLTEALRAKVYSKRKRLEIFLQVVDAVQHAHQRLVVHRDLKPANILLTAEGQTKLLDFGIAKLLDEAQPETALLTQAHQRLLTPRYAAPEQEKGGTISTATDVYQLGRILQEVVEAGEESPKPDPELRDIIGMATREDPDRRYGSASELGRDLRNYLENRPIQARPEAWTYLLSKFVERNRLGVIAASLILLSIVTGGLFSVYQAKLAQEALVRETEARKEAEYVTEFVVEMFKLADPYRTPDSIAYKDMPLQTFLDMNMPMIRTDLKDQPKVQMRVMRFMGELYDNLNLEQEGYQIQKELLDLTEANLGFHSEEYAIGIHGLASSAQDMGRIREADSLYRIAVEATREVFGLAPRQLAPVYNNFGLLYIPLGQPQTADSLYQLALEVMYHNGVVDTPNFAQTLNNRAEAFLLQQQIDSAYVYASKAVAVLEQANMRGDVFVAHAYSRLAQVLLRMDSLDIALRYEQEAQELFGKLLGERSHFYALSAYTQSKIFRALGKHEQEEDALFRTLDILRALYGEENANFQVVAATYAQAIAHRGAYAEAEQLLETSLAYFAEVGLHARLAAMLARYVDLCLEQGKRAQATRMVERYWPQVEQTPQAEAIRQALP